MTKDTTNTFHFELVSPAKKLMEEPAWQVTVPGEEGDLGVRAGHAPFVVSIRPGVVEITKAQGGTAEKIFIAGGFADISATNCTILAEEATPVAELSKADVEASLSELNSQLEKAGTDTEIKKLSARIFIEEAKLQAAA